MLPASSAAQRLVTAASESRARSPPSPILNARPITIAARPCANHNRTTPTAIPTHRQKRAAPGFTLESGCVGRLRWPALSTSLASDC
jgi:hypothetical protein